MKILIIKSSPHKEGSSNLLAEQFARGATSAGHETDIFDAAHASIGVCLGCDSCNTSGPCCQQDDMEKLKDEIRKCDLICFVTPLYYYSMSAQLKKVIDRFYSFNGELQSLKKKAVLISASSDNKEHTFDGLKLQYQILCDYLKMQDMGAVYGGGCGNVELTRRSPHMKEAFELGSRV